MRKNRLLWLGVVSLVLLLFAILVGPYLPFIDHQLEKKIVIQTKSEGYILPPYPFFTEDICWVQTRRDEIYLV